MKLSKESNFIKTVAVTGGNGFIGKKLIEQLQAQGHKVISLQRSSELLAETEKRYFDLSDISSINRDILVDVDVVIHAAALVHNPKADYNSYDSHNFQATKSLFSACVDCKIEKFIFLSTVGVYGLYSSSKKINIETKTSPISPYAEAKLKSEKFLLASDVATKVSIIRLPLVYGKNAPGNFGALEKIALSKVPLPFLNVNNKRSMVDISKLVKILAIAVEYKDRYLRLQLLCDEKSFSTQEIIKKIRLENGINPLLFPLPKNLFKVLLNAAGKKKIYEQLFEDLEFESTI
jgi:nucleoside-diphosphate-sugar epimerase